jgi:hypothetical protein
MLVNSGVRYKFHCILFNSNLYLLSLPGLNTYCYSQYSKVRQKCCLMQMKAKTQTDTEPEAILH